MRTGHRLNVGALRAASRLTPEQLVCSSSRSRDMGRRAEKRQNYSQKCSLCQFICTWQPSGRVSIPFECSGSAEYSQISEKRRPRSTRVQMNNVQGQHLMSPATGIHQQKWEQRSDRAADREQEVSGRPQDFRASAVPRRWIRRLHRRRTSAGRWSIGVTLQFFRCHEQKVREKCYQIKSRQKRLVAVRVQDDQIRFIFCHQPSSVSHWEWLMINLFFCQSELVIYGMVWPPKRRGSMMQLSSMQIMKDGSRFSFRDGRSAQQPTGDSNSRTIDQSEAQVLALMLTGISQKCTSRCTF